MNSWNPGWNPFFPIIGFYGNQHTGKDAPSWYKSFRLEAKLYSENNDTFQLQDYFAVFNEYLKDSGTSVTYEQVWQNPYRLL